MQQFGTYTGMAFQIKDDLFDYLSSNIIGKPVGIDIQEQKMTLPLIYTLRTADPEKRKYFSKQSNVITRNLSVLKNLLSL